MLAPAVLALAALSLLSRCATAASQIALFTDTNCEHSYKGLEGPNGYPNGSCTDIRRSGEFGSLMVVGVDGGCAVTIYVNDPTTTICGGAQQEISLGECWNSTYVYYSIDMCQIPDPSAPVFSPAPSSSTSPSASASTTPSASPSSGPPTAALAGGIIGGLAGLGLILGLALWVLRRKKMARKAAGQGEGVVEIDSAAARHEVEARKDVYRYDVVEAEGPVSELAGQEVRRYEMGGVGGAGAGAGAGGK